MKVNESGLTIILVTHNENVASRCPIQYSLTLGHLKRVK